MAKKKPRGVSKSQAVRDYLTQNPDATASVVVPELAQRGIDVSPALVSQIKQRMKQAGEETAGPSGAAGELAPKKTTVKKRAGKGGRVKRSANGAETAKALTADDLVEAKKLVDELGGIEQARKALKYLEELG